MTTNILQILVYHLFKIPSAVSLVTVKRREIGSFNVTSLKMYLDSGDYYSFF